MSEKIIKYIIVLGLTITVSVFTWFGKIPSEVFTGFASAAVMWFLNSKEVDKLNKEKEELTEQVNILEAEKSEIIEEKDILKHNGK